MDLKSEGKEMLNSYLKFYFLFILFIPACASLPKPPVPDDNNSAVLGVRVKLNVTAISSLSPDRVYFVRVDEPGQPLKKGEIIHSNYKDDDVFYVLNAKPGYYMLSFYKHAVRMNSGGYITTNRFTTLLSEHAALASKTRVESGKVVFMGDIKTDTSTNKDDSDEYQRYLVGSLQLKNTEVSDAILQALNPFSRNISYYIWYGNSQGADTSTDSKSAFLINSRKTFEKTAWSSKF